MRTGVFITLEGIEGSGKSTHALMLAEALRTGGQREVILTAEPGGTDIGRQIRGLLLDMDNKAMSAGAELLLYAASRRQHLDELVLPALERGAWVVCDRFSDSTRAYQGHARGLSMPLIEEIDRIATGGLKPDLTLLLDLNVEDGAARNRHAGKMDRLEAEGRAFHERVREGFLAIQRAEPWRVKLVNAAGARQDVHDAIMCAVKALVTGNKCA